MSIRECAPTVIERQGTKGPFVLRSFEHDDSYTVTDGTVVGRELDCEICLQFAKVSRYHAKFYLVAQSLYIEDLHSSNGTLVNGNRIYARTGVSLGDEITFGDVRYRMTSEAAGHSEATQLFNASALAPSSKGSIFQPSLATPPPARPIAEKASDQNSAPKAAPMSVQPSPPLQPQTAQSEDSSTRLYSPSQIMSMAQRNLDRHADLDVGSGPRFVILTAPLRGQVFEIGLPEPGSRLIVGRDKDCDLRIAEESVSRTHATITYSGLQFHIDTTHASNTLMINGETQKASAILRHGDKVQLGRIEALFRTDVKRVIPMPKNLTTTASYQKWLLVGICAVTLAMLLSIVLLN